MIRRTEMNSPTLIWPLYISEFCRGINKFSSKSIMHDFILLISSREVRRLPAFHHVGREKAVGSLGIRGVHSVCFVPNHNCLFSQPLHCKMYWVKSSNESEAGKATGISSVCFLGRLTPSKYERPSLSFLPFLLSFEPSEPPSLICLLRVPRNSLYAWKENLPVGCLLPWKEKTFYSKGRTFANYGHSVPFFPPRVLSGKIKVSSQTHSAEKSVGIIEMLTSMGTFWWAVLPVPVRVLVHMGWQQSNRGGGAQT